MTFEEMKTEKLNIMIEAAQDCKHHTNFYDLEKKLEWLEFTINELLCFAADEVQLRQEDKKVFLKVISGGAPPNI